MKPADIEKGMTAELLREVLRYEPGTGKFFWLKGNNQKQAGDEAGWLEKTGYLRITVLGERYVAHRLAWLYMTGEWPSDRIDHENLNKSDNRWKNLRPASDSQNSANQKTSRANTTGVKGVSVHYRGKYVARLRRMHLGLFETMDAAKAAYDKKAKEVFGEFARTDA